MSSLTSCEKTNRRPAYFFIIYGRGTGGHRPKPRSNFPEMELHCLNVAKPITPLLRSTPLLRYFATSWRCRFSQESTGVEGRRLRRLVGLPSFASLHRTIWYANQAAEQVAYVKKGHPEVTEIFGDFKFRGQGQKRTDMADLRGAVELTLLLPGRHAAPGHCTP